MIFSRRKFVRDTGLFVATASLMGCKVNSSNNQELHASEDVVSSGQNRDDLFFKISLAQWSLHRALESGELSNIDFARVARNDYDVDGIEYVSRFFEGRCEEQAYLDLLNQEAQKYDIEQLIIMVDGEGALADTDSNQRDAAVQNHYKWVDAAQYLGCHSIRVNCHGEGSKEEVKVAGEDGLKRLSTYALEKGVNVIVENHGGYSSDGSWLSNIIAAVDMKNCGTLPDFGNFCIRKNEKDQKEECLEAYDRYQGLKELIPYAKGVSAKSYAFDDDGLETTIDYEQMLNIIKEAGYKGYIGIEYEGDMLPEYEGIQATKALLLRLGKKLSSSD